MSDWRIGLSSWIIQDGNYGDFECGLRAEFAVEFYPHEWRPSKARVRRATWLQQSLYRVNAEVTFASPECVVIDCGVISAYRQGTSGGVVPGAWVEAEVYLGIDPFFYFEDLAHLDGVPPLIHTWRVTGIALETTPFLESRDDHGRRVRTRDASRVGHRPVRRTNAWTDDGGSAEYVLSCALLEDTPRRQLGSINHNA